MNIVIAGTKKGGVNGVNRSHAVCRGNHLRVIKVWFICLLCDFLLSQSDDTPDIVLRLSHLDMTQEETCEFKISPAWVLPAFSLHLAV